MYLFILFFIYGIMIYFIFILRIFLVDSAVCALTNGRGIHVQTESATVKATLVDTAAHACQPTTATGVSADQATVV